mmetsp:Transcript_9131/g.16577  ORF Transcript_9131/g.16577 Transcript_9131/m.16577 type:complete len:204 (-) Transcript_9131:446-1057(-)
MIKVKVFMNSMENIYLMRREILESSMIACLIASISRDAACRIASSSSRLLLLLLISTLILFLEFPRILLLTRSMINGNFLQYLFNFCFWTSPGSGTQILGRPVRFVFVQLKNDRFERLILGEASLFVGLDGHRLVLLRLQHAFSKLMDGISKSSLSRHAFCSTIRLLHNLIGFDRFDVSTVVNCRGHDPTLAERTIIRILVDL